MLLAQADGAWLRRFREPPKMIFTTQGKPATADALRHRITEELGWPHTGPDYRDEAVLS